MLLVVSSSISISNAKAFYMGRLLSLLQFSEWKAESQKCVMNSKWSHAGPVTLCSKHCQSKPMHTKYTLTHLKMQGISLYSRG